MAPFQTDERFFTKDWSITLPSSPVPNLTFKRLTPSDMTAFVHFAEGAPDIPDPQCTAPPPPPSIPGPRMQRMYIESRTRHHALEAFISLDDKFVGWGGVFQITPPNEEPSVANIGIKLSPDVRGRGLGKMLMQILLRLSNELEVDVIEAGTWKYNVAMRALAKSVGLVETDEGKDIPGVGVVADLMFKDIERERWRDLDMVVEFRDQVEESD